MPPGMLGYRWFAAAYQWTPAQVDDLDLEHADWLVLIENAERHAQEIRNKRSAPPEFPAGPGGFGGSR